MSRLYYIDSYKTEMQSRVVSTSDDGLRVVLEETNFYPTSGGQPHDVGALNGIAVVDVVDDSGAVVHVLGAPLTGEAVEGEIDWTRRYDHMQQHTGQHLLSAVFDELFQIPTLSFHMGADDSSIELRAKELSQLQMDAVTLRATELARANPRIGISFEEAAEAQGLRKATEREGTLRIVEIPGVDRSACGGTHVGTLAEVLPVQIRDMDKVRGNVRISFVCGNRAISSAQSDFQMLSRVAVNLGISRDKVEPHVTALKQALAESEKQRQRLELESATRAGVDLYTRTDPGDDDIRRVAVSEAAIDENARNKAKAFAGGPKAVILMHSSEGLLLACSPDSGVNAGALLKQALSKFGARGGGSATMAQGNLPDKEIVQELARALGFGNSY